jgi:hypothetical protein
MPRGEEGGQDRHLTLPMGFWETVKYEKKGCIIQKNILITVLL